MTLNTTLATFPETLFSLIRYYETHWIYPFSGQKPKHPQSIWYIEYINRQLSKLECAVMPTKRANKAKQWRNDNVEFVNINLNKAQKEHFRGWFMENEKELPNLLAIFMSAGYKISLKYDTEHECYISTATCFDSSMENYNKALSSRSADWFEAMALTLWKTDVLCEDGVWENSAREDNWG